MPPTRRVSAGVTTNGKEITMDARLSYRGNTLFAKFGKYINSAGAVLTDSPLPAATQELVKLRASQINGCALCTDMHAKEAEHAGEGPGRLELLAASREGKVFTHAQRGRVATTTPGPTH